MTVRTMLPREDPTAGTAPQAQAQPKPKSTLMFASLPDDLLQLLFYPLPSDLGHRRYLPPRPSSSLRARAKRQQPLRCLRYTPTCTCRRLMLCRTSTRHFRRPSHRLLPL
ncbi:hypothetical protein BCR44DRAFT_1001105 [Catenaria anguillulae PL171]|uniref:Uncharacterized protein n=1 Tax=Catenaria anguillulae PL171 TaxID=765915 RepID=A0A1Y2I2W6_9FUNG|nr:hypothetical protein BCR44DRAFT_1001105 [Catenaria anguillulae PL171]